MQQKDSTTKSTITDYHAKYFAHLLTRRGGEGIERLSQSLFDAFEKRRNHEVEVV